MRNCFEALWQGKDIFACLLNFELKPDFYLEDTAELETGEEIYGISSY